MTLDLINKFVVCEKWDRKSWHPPLASHSPTQGHDIINVPRSDIISSSVNHCSTRMIQLDWLDHWIEFLFTLFYQKEWFKFNITWYQVKMWVWPQHSPNNRFQWKWSTTMKKTYYYSFNLIESIRLNDTILVVHFLLDLSILECAFQLSRYPIRPQWSIIC